MSDDNFGPWIDWAGGECPIPDAKAGEYEIEFRDGDVRDIGDALSYNWSQKFGDFSIRRYRVRLPADDMLRKAIEALRHADMFITNGVENGYIRLPSTPDPALETPNLIRAVLTAYDKREPRASPQPSATRSQIDE